MNIAQALKQKAVLVSKIAKITSRMLESNSYNVKNKPSYNSKELYNQLLELKSKLVALKLAIMKASDPIREQILTMAEIKDTITNLNAMNVSAGEVSNYRSDALIVMACTISMIERDAIISAAEETILKIQNDVDNFNAVTQVVLR